MTEPGAWPSIRAEGLASAAALVERFGAAPALVAGRRPAAVTLHAPGRDPVVLRDNGVLHDGQLARCLEGMDVADFYRMLNARVYLWPTRQRVAGPPGGARLPPPRPPRARAGHRRPAGPARRGGAPVPHQHGGDADQPAAPRPRHRPPLAAWPRGRTVAEVTVEHAVPDAADLVLAAAVHHPGGRVEPVDL